MHLKGAGCLAGWLAAAKAPCPHCTCYRRRCWREQRRRWATMLVQVLQSMFMAALIGGGPP